MRTRTTLALAALCAAATLPLSCGTPPSELASDEAELRCPPEGCEIDDPTEPRNPREPRDPPPPPPPQPDRSKYRTTIIPVEFLKFQLLAALHGTKIQVSHTDGEPLTIYRPEQVCKSRNTAEVQACKAECNADPDLTPFQKSQCRAQCEKATTTCSNVCGSVAATSYIRWGNAALDLSKQTSPKTCNAKTCPACSTPTQVPALEHRALSVPIFDRSYDLGLDIHRIWCVVNRWTFDVVASNVQMAATKEGLRIRLAGSTGNPAIHCEGAPDPEVDNLALEVWFKFPAPGISVDATLTGEWRVFGPVVDFLADLDDRISSAVKEKLHDSLNTAPAQDLYRNIFRTVVANYVKDTFRETLANMGSIYAESGGIRVNYWVE